MQLIIQMPDIYFVDEEVDKITQKVKLYTALMMFRTGKISAGAACEIAQIDRYQFNQACKKHNIPVINYDIEEIKNELKQYQRPEK